MAWRIRLSSSLRVSVASIQEVGTSFLRCSGQPRDSVQAGCLYIFSVRFRFPVPSVLGLRMVGLLISTPSSLQGANRILLTFTSFRASIPFFGVAFCGSHVPGISWFGSRHLGFCPLFHSFVRFSFRIVFGCAWIRTSFLPGRFFKRFATPDAEFWVPFCRCLFYFSGDGQRRGASLRLVVQWTPFLIVLVRVCVGRVKVFSHPPKE